ncbi:hypothetical protein C488_03615 [Natrinema pellirubrum DSM 15624]|uniref:Small CPxCG-related zinc finger protein n=1 Tax=Natrinema pellirubrum (strain DSM 15624 / CIP 106293 / JCM 10476 / NCIMB 786 / 157) TaxID=797303 RepID=L0JHI2_NATP1|nr:hypothetical protein [Natrinema pellirubrum]AGB30769.1 hypothetical protein Natpe_0852 [Natrinema pellirubrum DSM 15624]ELY80845.1 hypothetical protein C488_03615 [Natrinema pellirubrum DSM 15624]
MDSRRKSQSLSSRLRERVRSTLLVPGRSRDTETDGGTDAAEASAGDRGGDPDAPGNLFHCSNCGLVYIDAEKRVCSQCETDVERVRSTLACNR